MVGNITGQIGFGSGARPIAQISLRLGAHLIQANVAGHDQGGVGRAVIPLEFTNDVLPRHGGHGFFGSRDGVTVSGALREDQAGSDPAGDHPGVVQATAQVGQVFPSQPLQFMVGKSGIFHQVRQQFQRRGPVFGHGVGGQEGVFPLGVGGYPGSDGLEGGGDLLAGPVGGPFRQHLGRDAGQARLLFGIGDGAGLQVDSEVDQGHAPFFNDGYAQSIAELAPLRDRRGERRFLRRRRHHPPVYGAGGRTQGLLRQHAHPHLRPGEQRFGNPEYVFPADGHVLVQAGVDQAGVDGEGVEVV